MPSLYNIWYNIYHISDLQRYAHFSLVILIVFSNRLKLSFGRKWFEIICNCIRSFSSVEIDLKIVYKDDNITASKRIIGIQIKIFALVFLYSYLKLTKIVRC